MKGTRAHRSDAGARREPGEGAAARLVRRVCAILDEESEERPTLAALAARVGLSPFHLQRTFKRLTGLTPREYADARRMGRFKRMLQGKESITMATYEAGYGSVSRLYERTPGLLGMTPSAYRSGGKGTEIRYTIAPSPLGKLLLAATGRGLCAVKMGDAERALTKALEREYPAATIRRDAAGLRGMVSTLQRQIRGGEPPVDLPLDVRATAFQWKVWRALCAIPPGETRSYHQIARSIGSPRGSRAVGRACATNPVAIVIPCHRAVRSDGTLGGYAYGLPRKRKLLDLERKQAEGKR
jgi:AraC family transcriptional regulator of adaptative response/methylated-DNA-[protein]-cysteine methyltransferase